MDRFKGYKDLPFILTIPQLSEGAQENTIAFQCRITIKNGFAMGL